jgi:hypothetical protein
VISFPQPIGIETKKNQSMSSFAGTECVGNKYPPVHHGSVTSRRPSKRLLMGRLKDAQRALVGWQSQTSRENTGVGRERIRSCLCMWRTRTMTDDSSIVVGRNVARVSHPDLRANPIANQICDRIKSHTYDDSWYRNAYHIFTI